MIPHPPAPSPPGEGEPDDFYQKNTGFQHLLKAGVFLIGIRIATAYTRLPLPRRGGGRGWGITLGQRRKLVRRARCFAGFNDHRLAALHHNGGFGQAQKEAVLHDAGYLL